MNQQETPYFDESLALRLPFESLLTESEIHTILESSNIVEYAKRDVIIKQNSRVTDIPIIISGLAKVSCEMRKGKHIMLRIAQPLSFACLSSALNSEVYDYSVIALEPTAVRFVGIDTIKKIAEKNGPFGLELLKDVSSDNIFNVYRLSSLLYKQLPGRVADLLLYFSEDIYKSLSFTIPLTRQEMAELAGTTKESLIRTLSEFKNDKIIEMDRNIFSVNSMNIIKTLSRLG
jgi:CRP/FNR family transcriptional regulator, polysaccharide utilization system transcription regulator